MTRAADERKAGPRPGAFLPLVLLVCVALIVGFLNLSLVEPYTSPRVAADDQGAYVFYDTAERTNPSEHAFLLRRTQDGDHFDKAQRSDGQLRSATILSDEHLACLFPEFFSVYSRVRGLDREWSGSAAVADLGFEAAHLARRAGRVHAFGTMTKDGALRAARLESEPRGARAAWNLVAQETRVERAAEPPGPAVVERGDEANPTVPPPVAWASAEEQGGHLALFFRVQKPRPRGSRGMGEPTPGNVRLVRFDGTAFLGSEAVTLEEDLSAFAAVSVVSSGATAALTTRVHVFGVRRGDEEARILEFVLEGSKLRQVDAIPYKKGGFFEDRPAQALAAFSQKGRTALLAQVGGSVRAILKKDGRWGEWGDVARMPIEALALVYFYLGSLLALGAVMIVAGLWALRKRLGRAGSRDLDEATAERLVAEALGAGTGSGERDAPQASRTPASPPVEPQDPSENDAPIHDRLVAFLIDFAIVVGILWIARSSFQFDLVKPGEDPTRNFAVMAWCGVVLLAYLTLTEAIFGRTPGKRLLGLEIKTLDGKDAPLVARLYRNLFRVEIIFLATMIPSPAGGEQRFFVPLMAIAVMLGTPRAQRPGDVIAGTVVQRQPEPRRDERSTGAEEEESA